MVSFDFSFRSMMIEGIVEDAGGLRTKEGISWIFINRGSYQYNRVHVVSSGAKFRSFGSFFEVLIKENPKTKTGLHADIPLLNRSK